MTEKEKKQGDTDRTMILFLIPWYFRVKYQGMKEQYYRPVCVSSCFFLFSVVPNPLKFLLIFLNLLVVYNYIPYCLAVTPCSLLLGPDK